MRAEKIPDAEGAGVCRPAWQRGFAFFPGALDKVAWSPSEPQCGQAPRLL